MSFGVLTLNFWNINEPLDTRYGALETGLKRLRPDIVCLQEVDRDPKSGRSQSEIIAKMCSHAHVVEDDGLAIVCSIPVVRSARVSLPEFPEDLPRGILSAELLIENRSLLVTNTHLAYPPKMIQERKKQAEMLLASIEQHRSAGRRIAKILCGDFNDVPNSYTYFHIRGNRQDAFIAKCFGIGRSYIHISPTLRIDYILPTDDFRIIQTMKLNFPYSDHHALITDLQLQDSKR